MRNRVVGICRGLFILAMAATLVITMGSLAQAKNKELMSKGFEMMLTSFNHMDNGVQTINKGVGMIDQIAKEKGFTQDIAPARKTIDGGMAIGGDGFKVFREGQKLYLANKGKFNKPMVEGVELMIKGAGTIGRAVKRIEEGLVKVNQVAGQKGVADMMNAPNQTIKAGIQITLGGVELFARGKTLYMENK